MCVGTRVNREVLTFDSPGRNVKLLVRDYWKRPRLPNLQKIDKDPFVKDTLKTWDRNLYSECAMYSRIGGDLEALERQLQSYDRDYPVLKSIPQKKRYQLLQAYELARKDFKLEEKAVPRWIYDVPLESATSSGWPHFRRKGDIKDTIYGEARRDLHFMKTFGTAWQLPPCVFAKKGKLSVDGPDLKTRLVWQYPAAMTVCEGVFAVPLIEAYYKKRSDLMLTGTRSIFKHQWLSSNTRDDQTFYGLDFSQYDASLPAFMIFMAFAVFAENLLLGAYEDSERIMYGGTGTEERANTAFWAIVNYFVNTPFLTPKGHLMKKHGGVPSGSNFTNLLESFITRWLIYFILISASLLFLLLSLYTNGDDSAFILKCGAKLDLNKASADLALLGIVLKPEKTVVTNRPREVHASGSHWRNSLPVRDTIELFRLAMCPKGWVPDCQTAFDRLTGIWMCGGFNDPVYCRFYEYFQTCYELRRPTDKVLEWKARAFGFGRKDIKSLNMYTLYMHYV